MWWRVLWCDGICALLLLQLPACLLLLGAWWEESGVSFSHRPSIEACGNAGPMAPLRLCFSLGKTARTTLKPKGKSPKVPLCRCVFQQTSAFAKLVCVGEVWREPSGFDDSRSSVVGRFGAWEGSVVGLAGERQPLFPVRCWRTGWSRVWRAGGTWCGSPAVAGSVSLLLLPWHGTILSLAWRAWELL